MKCNIRLIVFALVFLIVLFIPVLNYSYYKGFFQLGILGGIGYTGGNKVDVGDDGNLLNYRGHIQASYKFHKHISAGVDIFYMHALIRGSNITHQADAPKQRDINYVGTYAIVNFHFFNDFFRLSLGPGALIGVGDNKDVEPGVLIDFAIEIDLGANFYLPLLTRVEFIIGERFLVPINFMTGIVYKFK